MARLEKRKPGGNRASKSNSQIDEIGSVRIEFLYSVWPAKSTQFVFSNLINSSKGLCEKCDVALYEFPKTGGSNDALQR